MDNIAEPNSLILAFNVPENESKNMTEKKLKELFEKHFTDDLERISKTYSIKNGIKIVDWLYIVNACAIEWPAESEFTIEAAKKELISLDYVKNINDNSRDVFL